MRLQHVRPLFAFTMRRIKFITQSVQRKAIKSCELSVDFASHRHRGTNQRPSQKYTNARTRRLETPNYLSCYLFIFLQIFLGFVFCFLASFEVALCFYFVLMLLVGCCTETEVYEYNEKQRRAFAHLAITRKTANSCRA